MTHVPCPAPCDSRHPRRQPSPVGAMHRMEGCGGGCRHCPHRPPVTGIFVLAGGHPGPLTARPTHVAPARWRPVDLPGRAGPPAAVVSTAQVAPPGPRSRPPASSSAGTPATTAGREASQCPASGADESPPRQVTAKSGRRQASYRRGNSSQHPEPTVHRVRGGETSMTRASARRRSRLLAARLSLVLLPAGQAVAAGAAGTAGAGTDRAASPVHAPTTPSP